MEHTSTIQTRVNRLEERVKECNREKDDLLYEIDTLNKRLEEQKSYNALMMDKWDHDRSELVHTMRQYGKLLEELEQQKQNNINLYAETMALKLNQIILLSDDEKRYICEYSGICVENMDEFLTKFNDLRLQYLNIHRP